MYSNKNLTNPIFLGPHCKLRNLVFSARFMNPNQEKKIVPVIYSTALELG